MMATKPTEGHEPAAHSRGRMIRRVWDALGGPLAVAALIHPLAFLLGRLDWRVDLLTHFRSMAVLVSLLAALWWMRKRRWLGVAFAILAVVQVLPLFRYNGTNPVPPDPRSSERLRVFMANVLEVNDSYGNLTALIRSEHPDVVGLVEVTDEWIDGLERTGIRAEFPYRLERPDRSRGLALWFRERPERWWPIQVTERGGSPFMSATIRFAGQPLRIWLVHPPNPLNYGAEADRQLVSLGRRIGLEGGEQLVIGDLNRSEESPRFLDFLAASGLRDSRMGFGRQPTWPSGFGPFRIAIDHAFVSSSLSVVERRVGPRFGSDHHPLVVEVAPAASSATKSDQTAASSAPAS